MQKRTQKPSSLRSQLSIALLLLAGACGGKAQSKVQYAEATPEQERVFEHGVDFVAALEGLEGRWRDDWDRDLQERVASADFIGTVKVKTLLTETDPEQRVTYRLVATVDRTLVGDAGKEVELRVRQGQPGFPSVHDNLQRIQDRRFIAFVRWYGDDVGEKAAHFHLSPASEVIVSQTESTVALKKKLPSQSTERVIVHTN
jgi:hypothetical protein